MLLFYGLLFLKIVVYCLLLFLKIKIFCPTSVYQFYLIFKNHSSFHHDGINFLLFLKIKIFCISENDDDIKNKWRISPPPLIFKIYFLAYLFKLPSYFVLTFLCSNTAFFWVPTTTTFLLTI